MGIGLLLLAALPIGTGWPCTATGSFCRGLRTSAYSVTSNDLPDGALAKSTCRHTSGLSDGAILTSAGCEHK